MIDIETILPYYLVIIIVLFFCYFLARYVDNVNNQTKYFKYILITLRFSTVFLLLLILFNPIIKINTKDIKNKKIAFFVDDSKSMLLSDENFDLITQLNKIESYLIDKKIESEYYAFSDTIKKIKSTSQLKFNGSSTDLNKVIQNIDKISANEYILISDGMQNEGMIKNNNRSLNQIYTFGIGNDSIFSEDLKIDSLVILNNNSNSIDIKCQISSNLLNTYSDVKINLSNQNYNNLNISNIDIEDGKNIFFHNIKIEKDILSKHNIISIENLNSEKNLHNNYLDFQLDDRDLKIYKGLLVSGRLSNNTKFIKNVLTNYKNIDFEHIFKIDDIIDLKEKDYDIIVFDSFPINNKQLKVISGELLKSQKLVYFQGPIISNNLFTEKFLSDTGYSIDIINEDNRLSNNIYLESTVTNNDIINGILDDIAPFNSNFLVKSNNSLIRETIFNKESRESILLDYTDDKLFIFIPDLKKISNDTKRFNKVDNLTYLINYYIDRILNESDMLDIYTNKSHFYIDENIQLYLNVNNKDYFKKSKFDLFIYDKNFDIITKINEFNFIDSSLYQYNLKLYNPQKHYAQIVSKANGDILIKSNMIEFDIFDIDKELYDVGLNEELLRMISFNSKGEYYKFDELFKYIMKINESQLITFKLDKIKIFNFQAFWFIVLLLLILEWFIRKNKGLL